MPSPATMHLGVCSWSLHPANAAELIERLQACGLSRLQLALNPLHLSAGDWSDVARRLDDAGVSVVSGMFGTVGEDYTTLESIRRTGGLVPDATWPQNQAIAQAALRVAAPMNIPAISTHIGFIPHDHADPGFTAMVDRVRWVADLFKAKGVTLLMETGQETAEALWQFLDAVDRDNVGVNFDPANMILYDKGDPVASLRRLMPRVRQVHIKDAIRTKTPGEWGSEVPVGDGEVDWLAFLGELVGAGFAGNLIIEREAGARRIEEVRLAATRVKAWLASIGAAAAAS